MLSLEAVAVVAVAVDWEHAVAAHVSDSPRDGSHSPIVQHVKVCVVQKLRLVLFDVDFQVAL